MKFYIVPSLFYAVAFLNGVSTSAAIVPPTPHPLLRPISFFEKSLAKPKKVKVITDLEKAYLLLKDEENSKALQVLAPHLKNDLWGDYATWMSASAHLGRAQEELDEKKYPSALTFARKSEDLFIHIQNHFPLSPVAKSAMKGRLRSELAIAESYWGLKDWKKSQTAFHQCFDRLLAASLLSLLNSQDIRHYGETCEKKPHILCGTWFQKIAALTQKRPLDQKALLEHFALSFERPKSYRPGSSYSVSYKAPDQDQALYESAMQSFQEEEYKEAGKKFKQFLDDFPRSPHRYRVRFWYGQALERRGETDEAKAVFQALVQETPMSFYGLAASISGNIPLDPQISNQIPLGIESDPALFPNEWYHLDRTSRLIASGAYQLASLELRELKPREGLQSPFLLYLAYLGSLSQNHRTAFIFYGDLIQRGYEGMVSTWGLNAIFPKPFLSIIQKYASEYSLDPILVLSLIKQESAFEWDAISSSGALGLMQLMPFTAADMDPKLTTGDLVQAEQNIRVGCMYLKRLLSRFKGNIPAALAGYNAGPTVSERWFKFPVKDNRFFESVEAITYKETREYVQSIFRNYYWYSRLLKKDTSNLVPYFWSYKQAN